MAPPTSRRSLGWSAVAASAALALVSYGLYTWTRRPSLPSSDSDPNRFPSSREPPTLLQTLQSLGRAPANSSHSRSHHSQRPKATLCLNHTLIWNPSKDPASPNLAFKPGALALLQALTTHFDLYLIANVESPVHQAHLTDLLRDREAIDFAVPIPTPTHISSEAATSATDPRIPIDSRKLLFCQSSPGKSHIVRHIDPQIHIDADPDCLSALILFVPQLIWLRRRCHATTPSLLSSPRLPSHSTTLLPPPVPCDDNNDDDDDAVFSSSDKLSLSSSSSLSEASPCDSAILQTLRDSAKVRIFDNIEFKSIPR
ncbi:hypothetical protein H4R33_003372 [Dimargaris cristalligena]|nr:hypothetical protein H4R33_003372 [Dimargaris cristalligena]